MAQRRKSTGNPRGRPPKNKNPGTRTDPRAAPAENKEQTAGNSVLLNIAPFILFIVAVYILVSFFMSGGGGAAESEAAAASGVGVIGDFIRNIFYGLLGAVAVLVPVGMGSIAFFLKRDIQSGFFKYRLIFSITCVILLASMFHLASGETAKEAGYSLSALYGNGINSTGGGVLGGYLAETLKRIVGIIGAWIFTISLAVVFSTFLFGRTPAGIVRIIIKFIKDYNESDRTSERFERNIIVKTPEPGRRFKAKTHRYKITSHVDMPAGEARARKNFQPDISLDPLRGKNKNRKKSKTGDIHISSHPFANDFTGEAETETEAEQKITANENAGIQAKYETPLMIPDEELFGAGDQKNADAMSGLSEILDRNSDFDDLVIDTDKFDKTVNLDIAGDESFGDIKIVESAPQIRGDEPDIDDTNNINFEKEKLFEDDLPAKKEYKLPPISYLTKDTSTANVDIREELQTTAKKLTDTLASFGVRTKIYDVSRGPSITRYEISPDSGTKVNSIVNLVNDISLNLAAEVRIEAPIPGKAAIGVEVPNKNRETVHLRNLLEEPQFVNASSKITVALGMDVAGNGIFSDIAKMPHLLIAGATGMGKSVCINSIITSILYKATPDEVKLILIDPKKVELNIYNGIPHLLVPVVSDPKKAAGSLSWAVNEMENRYMLIEEKAVRDFKAYNDSIAGDPFAEPLPQIVIIVDELADLMLTAPADVEQSINRLAAKARAAGIHLIVGTQRPSVDVITGLIKANIPTRIAFTVVSQIDSRTIINMAGAEKLIGRGDMLYVPTGIKPMRVQGAFVSEKDVLSVVEFWKKQSDGQYDETILSEIEQEAARCNTKGAKIKDRDSDDIDADDEFKKDAMLKDAIELAIDMGTVSTSLLQRKLSLGYGRAGRIVDTMERMNIIGPFEGSKPRRVLITRQEFIEMTMRNE